MSEVGRERGGERVSGGAGARGTCPTSWALLYAGVRVDLQEHPPRAHGGPAEQGCGDRDDGHKLRVEPVSPALEILSGVIKE